MRNPDTKGVSNSTTEFSGNKTLTILTDSLIPTFIIRNIQARSCKYFNSINKFSWLRQTWYFLSECKARDESISKRTYNSINEKSAHFGSVEANLFVEHKDKCLMVLYQ